VLETDVYNTTKGTTILYMANFVFSLWSTEEAADKKDATVLCVCLHFKKGSLKVHTKRSTLLVLLSFNLWSLLSPFRVLDINRWHLHHNNTRNPWKIIPQMLATQWGIKWDSNLSRERSNLSILRRGIETSFIKEEKTSRIYYFLRLFNDILSPE